VFRFLRWLLGFAPWGNRFECDRAIEFECVNIAGESRHHPIRVQQLIERLIGPSTITGVYPGGDHEYTFLVSRMERIRDMQTGRFVRRCRFAQWLKRR
jgi:hypothetical protein